MNQIQHERLKGPWLEGSFFTRAANFICLTLFCERQIVCWRGRMNPQNFRPGMKSLSLWANLHCNSPEPSVFPFLCRNLHSHRPCISHPTKLLTRPSSEVVFLCSFSEKLAHACPCRRTVKAPKRVRNCLKDKHNLGFGFHLFFSAG